MIDIAIKIDGISRTLTHRHTTDEPISMSQEDPVLKDLMEKAVDEFKPESDDDVDAQVIAKMKWYVE